MGFPYSKHFRWKIARDASYNRVVGFLSLYLVFLSLFVRLVQAGVRVGSHRRGDENKVDTVQLTAQRVLEMIPLLLDWTSVRRPTRLH